jgi:hypothetical protein
MEFIAGLTEGGVPYGLFEEDSETNIIEKSEKFDNSYDKMLF